jgi:peptide/nickel transport system substrate-binding protein
VLKRNAFIVWLSIIVILFALSGCSRLNSEKTATPEIISNTETPIPTPIPTPTATPLPRSLVVCLGQEPSSLYVYGSSSRATWDVLEAIYDGPIDTRQFSSQPVILEKLPSLADGDAVFHPIEVHQGDTVVDSSGKLVALESGIVVLPSGCSDPSCAQTWDGASPLTLDQLTLTYKIEPGITWSDGIPLTASDSVYSYTVAADSSTLVSKELIYRTISYQALDELTAQWMGVPGYIPFNFDALFFLPLPQHAWSIYSAADLYNQDNVNRSPLGWGPYVIQEWIAGDHITLAKNPLYFRAGEGLPYFDFLVFRFLGEPGDNNLAALLSGECDVVDQTSLLDEELEAVVTSQNNGQLQAYIGQGPEWEHIDFGIKPASYDDGYSPVAGDRPDFFGDVRVRQAFAYCMDRQSIVDEMLFGQSSIPAGFYPSSHPLYSADLTPIPFDLPLGRQLLDEAGWKDWDGDPATPLQAVQIPNVPDGTYLSLKYYTSEAPLRVEVAKKIAASLAECGIQVEVVYQEPGTLFAPGPDGVLFGRNFDLAEFSWKSGAPPFCEYYTTDQIPTIENSWVTVNLTGYSSQAYDAACQSAVSTRPDQPEYYQRNLKVQQIFNEDVPAIPLYFRLKIAISRPDFCHFNMDVTARSDLWNLEELDYGEGCQ